MAPIIGITCGHQWKDPERYYVNAGYIDCITAAGGVPILIPYTDEEKLKQIVAKIDGLLLPGGIDIDARLFGEEPHPGCGEIDPRWDQLDSMVIELVRKRQLPILAICRGIQILNVACGGTIIQDIPSQVNQPIKHTQEAPKFHPTHSVRLKPDTILSEMFQANTLWVNSFHHQAVGKVAPGFKASAQSSDGVIEAIENEEHPYMVGVQWHPELMVSHYPKFRELFNRLVKTAHES